MSVGENTRMPHWAWFWKKGADTVMTSVATPLVTR